MLDLVKIVINLVKKFIKDLFSQDRIIFKRKDKMERKVGEIFNFKDICLRVEESPKQELCYGCYFSKHNRKYSCHEDSRKCLGNCSGFYRRDQKSIIFIEVNKVNKDKENKYE